MENKENIKQHFVPQCYLRNFSPNRNNVFIYDKIERKPYRNTVDKIAYKDFFYELPEKFIENIDKIPYGTKFFEKEFFANNIENQYNLILENITSKGESWIKDKIENEIITQKEKEIFAQLIAIQYLRMPDIRQKYSNAQKKGTAIRAEIIKSILSHEKPELKEGIENIDIKYDEDFDPILHSEIYADEKLYVGIANQIINKHWVYFITNNNDFYTSDNPIIIKPHIEKQKHYYEGFGMRGAEIIFPISSSILLSMWDSAYFETIEQKPDSFNKINDKQKREYNCLQYMFSNRQTYSYNDEFGLIKSLISCNNGNEIFGKKSKILVNGQ